jgi:hypothetical protein
LCGEVSKKERIAGEREKRKDKKIIKINHIEK